MIERRTFRAMDGDCELFGSDVSAAVLADGQDWVIRMYRRFSRFSPWSEISLFNDSAFVPRPLASPSFGQWVSISSDLELLLRECLRAYEKSQGLVHAGILPALRAAGYTRDFAEGPTPATPAPPPLAPLPELLEVRHREARLVKGTAIDLGGIAKGWMADRLADNLGDNVLVNLCGDLFARGTGESGEGWPVGFGDKTVLLRDMGAATSGTKKRAWDGGHHLIDPRTRLPAHTDLSEVSVLATTAADAEIYAKVALIRGSAEAASWLEGRALGWSLL